MMPTEAEIRRAILEDLRGQSREQPRTGEILVYDLDATAQRLKTSRNEVSNNLSDLLNERLVEAYGNSKTGLAIDGHCRITLLGLRWLRGE
ncbi:MAG: hypothetical protein LC808_43195 [Actinobacteria bacterium]|nr:hypothetical protein [Actinomycetota bacterium]